MSALRAVMFTLVAAATPVAAWELRGGHKLSADMQPAVVAELLAKVEGEWTNKAMMALIGKTDNATALLKVQQSCVKIASSIVQGSSGNKDNVDEYMQEVCAADARSSPVELRCEHFAASLQQLLTDDEAQNRNELDFAQFCTMYYNAYVVKDAKAEADRMKKMAEEAADRAKKEAEEKAKREAEEKAKKEAEAKAKKEAEERAREAEEKAKKEAERKARDAEEKARKEAEDKAKQEAEEKANKEAKEKVKKEAEEKARAAEEAKKEAEEKAREVAKAAEKAQAELREAEEKARKAADVAAEKRKALARNQMNGTKLALARKSVTAGPPKSKHLGANKPEQKLSRSEIHVRNMQKLRESTEDMEEHMKAQREVEETEDETKKVKQMPEPEQNKEEQEEEENMKQKTEHEQTQADNQEVLEVRAMDEKAKTHEERAADVARVVAKAGKTSGTMHTMYGKGAMKDAEKVRKSHKERSADASRKVAESRAHRITVLEPPKEKRTTQETQHVYRPFDHVPLIR